jgi:hypothetical protein
MSQPADCADIDRDGTRGPGLTFSPAIADHVANLLNQAS